MTSPSFAFVPRNVSKTKRQGSSAHVSSSLSFEPTSSGKRPRPPVGEGKAFEQPPTAKPVYNAQDISILVALAFSDYALWVDSDLRRKIEESMQAEEHDAGCMFHSFLTCVLQDLCIYAVLPLSYLMRCAFSRENLAYEHVPAEAGVVKAIRAYVGDVLEVRMLVSSPSTSAWYPSWKPERDSVGGYEVRRKDWSTLSDNATRDFTRAQWDDRTIYMVRLSSDASP